MVGEFLGDTAVGQGGAEAGGRCAVERGVRGLQYSHLSDPLLRPHLWDSCALGCSSGGLGFAGHCCGTRWGRGRREVKVERGVRGL